MAPDAVMKLSHIMRYVTDDVAEDFVALEKELACITDYIDLQRLRLNEKTIVDFSVNGEVQGRKIAPLVFMCFIENAFKYGVSSHEASPISIHISIGENNITLSCQNKIFSHSTRMERSGIGIDNTRRRLQHLYTNKHLLNITQEKGFYSVHLSVQA
jgi:LytS/YehU family sensor histidine kinase